MLIQYNLITLFGEADTWDGSGFVWELLGRIQIFFVIVLPSLNKVYWYWYCFCFVVAAVFLLLSFSCSRCFLFLLFLLLLRLLCWCSCFTCCCHCHCCCRYFISHFIFQTFCSRNEFILSLAHAMLVSLIGVQISLLWHKQSRTQQPSIVWARIVKAPVQTLCHAHAPSK